MYFVFKYNQRSGKGTYLRCPIEAENVHGEWQYALVSLLGNNLKIKIVSSATRVRVRPGLLFQLESRGEGGREEYLVITETPFASSYILWLLR